MANPKLKSDGAGGTLAELISPVICLNCGDVAEQCVSFVWAGTRRADLVSLGLGASVKHYYTVCNRCGSKAYS